MIRGWFRFEGGARLVAVSWSPQDAAWVDLLGAPLSKGEVLKNWGED